MDRVNPGSPDFGKHGPRGADGEGEAKDTSGSPSLRKTSHVRPTSPSSPQSTTQSMPRISADDGVMDQATKISGLPGVKNISSHTPDSPPVQVNYADVHKLLAHIGEDREDREGGVISMQEWEINFALLHSAYQQTSDPDLRQKIRFLMNNYLQKAAYFNTDPKFVGDQDTIERYREMTQHGQVTFGGMYHRTADSMLHHLSFLGYEGKFGDRETRVEDMIPIGTQDITHLYRLKFASQIGLGAEDSAANLLAKQFEASTSTPPEVMSTPVLIDVSDELGPLLYSNKDPAKVALYQKKREEVRAKVLQEIDSAVALIRQKHPDLTMSDDELQSYLLMNTAVVARGAVDSDLSVLSFCGDLFHDSDFKVKKMGDSYGKQHDVDAYHRKQQMHTLKLFPLSNYTGMGVGAVAFRMEIAKAHQTPEDLVSSLTGRPVTWAKGGASTSMMYSGPEDILGSATLQTMRRVAGDGDLYGEGQAVLAKGTSKMIDSLFSSISQEMWETAQQDPAAREVVQTALVRMMHHLGDANIHTKDFRKFSQAIDRVHAELTTILLFMHPYAEGTFEEKYGAYIQQILPAGIKPSSLGVGKSAMNIYSGVNAALQEDNPNPVRAFGAHTYYEQTGLFGNSPLDTVLSDPSVKKVDIFTCEFYHNIDPGRHEMRYQTENIIGDIKEIFHRKPDTDALTVVIDATIDMTKSEEMKALFEEFKEEIEKGRINFVVIRSGQKYDMLGLDNYFGAPFYLVNNGDPKWAKMNAVKGQAAHQTDALSQQYFHWMADAGPSVMDEYKARIYTNTRAILNSVPPSLKPSPGRSVVISEMDKGVALPFFEIAFQFDDPNKEYELMMWLHEEFARTFVQEGKMFYQRGSFGFAHPNFTMIDNKIRINPGLDPSDREVFVKFFAALEAKVAELEARE